jgi:hypothetical protein
MENAENAKVFRGLSGEENGATLTKKGLDRGGARGYHICGTLGLGLVQFAGRCPGEGGPRGVVPSRTGGDSEWNGRPPRLRREVRRGFSGVGESGD